MLWVSSSSICHECSEVVFQHGKNYSYAFQMRIWLSALLCIPINGQSPDQEGYLLSTQQEMLPWCGLIRLFCYLQNWNFPVLLAEILKMSAKNRLLLKPVIQKFTLPRTSFFFFSLAMYSYISMLNSNYNQPLPGLSLSSIIQLDTCFFQACI